MECMYCGGEHNWSQCPKIAAIRYLPVEVEGKVVMQVAEVHFFPPREMVEKLIEKKHE